MRRIVQGIEFEGKTVPDAFDVVVWENNGHREVSARTVIEWVELGPVADLSHLFGEPTEEELAAAAEERRQKNQERNAKRAKTACRRFIKSMGFDELATLTYRENQDDEELCKQHVAKWVRRMGALIPGFGYCAGYEPQQRGAWHAHLAIHKLPKMVEMNVPVPGRPGVWRKVKLEGWRVGTAVWRSIVGKDNGMCFIGGKGRGRGVVSSLAKLAGYVSKYITKHYELVPDGKRRWTHSEGCTVPKATRVRFTGVSLVELIAKCFWQDEGEVVVQHRVGHFGDSWYLCTETPQAGGQACLT